MSRRQAIATSAAAPLPAQSGDAKTGGEVVKRHDAAVEQALAAQIADARHGFGIFG
jgi:fructose-1,6-bisphosphatase/inositol monophosphatase family enzyme